MKNEGYNCECDISFLIGGEADYWNDIQEMLTERAKKYILVLSKNTFNKSGVLDEWEHCKSLEKSLGLKDFIIPVRIDEVPYNVRIGLNRKNIIPFEQWGNGLKRLLRKLEADEVPKNTENTLSIKSWYDNVYTTHSGVDNSRELFYSNWLQIENLPQYLYFYKFENDKQASELLKINSHLLLIRHGNYLISFSNTINTFIEKIDFTVPCLQKTEVATANAFDYYESDVFPGYQDLRNFIVRLLREAFHRHLISLDTSVYELANENKCYFFKRINDEKSKGEFLLNDKRKSIGVHGNYKENFWHFAISFLPLLSPKLCFSLKTHIVFTVDGINAIADKKKQHSFRRDKGKRMFNKEWRDQVLAYTSKLSQDFESNSFRLALSDDCGINVSSIPFIFNAAFGYIEPNDESRAIPIDDIFDDDEYFDELEKEYSNEE